MRSSSGTTKFYELDGYRCRPSDRLQVVVFSSELVSYGVGASSNAIFLVGNIVLEDALTVSESRLALLISLVCLKHVEVNE
jgi:hypothetical protein